jgi:hypothetical protein
MDWIKRNYDQFILALVALLLLALSGLLINSAIGFQQTFAGIKGEVIHHNEIPKVDIKSVQDGAESIKNPAKWVTTPDEGSFFISIPYIVVSGTLVDPRTSVVMLHPPVPNKWILDHHLDILDNNILSEDPDGDGFSNLDEYKGVKGDGSDSTDPNDKNSHPPYYTKLRLVKYIQVPFRLLFNAYDGDINHPETLDFQINTIDINQPSQFLKIGDQIAGTKFKIIKFASKHEVDPSTQTDTDVSELTVQNTESGDNVVLVLGKEANSPDSYALFSYLWNTSQFQVKLGKQFALPPETSLRYNLIDIKADHALIQTPTNEKVTVPLVDQQP